MQQKVGEFLQPFTRLCGQNVAKQKHILPVLCVVLCGFAFSHLLHNFFTDKMFYKFYNLPV